MKKKWNRSKGLVVFLLAAIMLVSVGCSSSKSDESAKEAPAENRAADSITFTESKQEAKKEEAVNDNQVNTENGTKVQNSAKLITTKYYDIETEAYDNSVAFIEKRVNALEGYIERMEVQGGSINQDYSNRYASFKLRIPKDRQDLFVKDLEQVGVILNRRQDVENITLEYFDMESRLHSKEVQYDRLIDILEKADDLKAVIEIQRELSDVTYEIDTMTSQLKKWDNLIDYTTVYVELYEVNQVSEVYVKPTLGERMLRTFKNSLRALNEFAQDCLLFLVAILPFAVVIGILVVLVLPIIKWARGKGKAKSDARREDKDE